MTPSDLLYRILALLEHADRPGNAPRLVIQVQNTQSWPSQTITLYEADVRRLKKELERWRDAT